MKTIEVKTQEQLDAAIKEHGQDYNVVIACIGRGFDLSVRTVAEIRLWENSTATLWGNSTATLRENSTATLRENSTATLWGNSTATLWENSTAKGAPFTAIHKISQRAQAEGGVIIERPDLSAGATWCEYYGLEAVDGIVTLYKAVDDDFKSGRGFEYLPGEKPEAPDWNDRAECGGGLHLSPHPELARSYHENATRFVACPVQVAEIVPILDYEGSSDKVKVPRIVEGCFEVDATGVRIKVPA